MKLLEKLMFGLLVSLIGSMIIYTHTKKYISTYTLLALIVILSILLLAFIYRNWITSVVYGKRLSVADLENVLRQYEISPGKPLFQLNEKDRNILDNRLLTMSRLRRPMVFFQLRFKRYINWIDAVYVDLLRNLANYGIRITLLVHDCEFKLEDEKVICLEDPRDYWHDIKTMVGRLKNLAGNEIKVETASIFFAKRRNSRLFTETIYKLFMPTIINYKELLLQKNQKDIDLIEQVHNLRYLIGTLAIRILNPKDILFILVWEGRQSYWSLLDNISIGQVQRTFPIIGSTIRSANGSMVGTKTEQVTLNLTDSPSVLREKLNKLDKQTMNTILRLLLCRGEWEDDWDFKSRDFLEAKIEEQIKNKLSD